MGRDLIIKEANRHPVLVDGTLPARRELSCPVQSYLLELRSPLSKRQQSSRLNVFARAVLGNEAANCFDIPWHAIDRETVNRVMQLMKDNGSAHSSINGLLSAVKGVLKSGYEHGLLPYERFRQVSSIKSYHLGDQLARRRGAVEQGDIKRLVSATARDPSPWGLRDHAMFVFMITTGVRRAEVVDLVLSRISLSKSVAVVVGKGGYQRAVGFPPATKQLVYEWINGYRGDEPGSLFSPITATESILTYKNMAPESVNRILKERSEEAGLVAGTIQPHDLRRTYASLYLAQDPDIVGLRDILGHKSVSTTEIYDRRKQEVTLQAMREFDVLSER